MTNKKQNDVWTSASGTQWLSHEFNTPKHISEIELPVDDSQPLAGYVQFGNVYTRLEWDGPQTLKALNPGGKTGHVVVQDIELKKSSE